MLDATAFACPSLTAFCRFDELGLSWSGSAWNRNVRCWPAASPRTTGGVAGAVMKDRRETA
jgi:hypothetical protein